MKKYNENVIMWRDNNNIMANNNNDNNINENNVMYLGEPAMIMV